MSKLLKNFVGIDISKLFFDAAVIRPDGPDQVQHRRFEQSADGFTLMYQWLRKLEVAVDEETLFCMEYTGIYNTALVNDLCSKQALLWIEMGIKIKKSEGFQRSSNDKTDSVKIALYALRFQDRKQLWSPMDESLVQIKHLVTQRDRIVDSITRLTVPIQELEEVGSKDLAKLMDKVQKPVVRSLIKAQAKIEAEIMKLVNQDKQLAQKVKRVTSITGVGDVTAIACLTYTRGFTSFESGKQFACYCGVVPFAKKESGSSIRSKSRVSPFANTKIKKLLHMCALSAIRYNTDLKAYYNRKIGEGKNKMAVINAVRNKLVLRIFAVLRDDRDFVENYVRKCA